VRFRPASTVGTRRDGAPSGPVRRTAPPSATTQVITGGRAGGDGTDVAQRRSAARHGVRRSVPSGRPPKGTTYRRV